MNEEIKKEARELVEKFASPLDVFKINQNSKRCALIAVDERINECNNFDRTDGYVQKRIDYQLVVKQAIEQL